MLTFEFFRMSSFRNSLSGFSHGKFWTNISHNYADLLDFEYSKVCEASATLEVIMFWCTVICLGNSINEMLLYRWGQNGTKFDEWLKDAF